MDEGWNYALKNFTPLNKPLSVKKECLDDALRFKD